MRGAAHRREPSRRLVALLAVSAALAGCGGSGQLDAELRPDAIASVRAIAGSTGLTLSDIDAGCAADALETDDATALVAAGDGPTESQVRTALDEVIECVGSEAIARSAIAPQAPGAAEDSIACAAGRFDSDLLVALLTSNTFGDPISGTDVELELATVLAACLSPEELLDLGQ